METTKKRGWWQGKTVQERIREEQKKTVKRTQELQHLQELHRENLARRQLEHQVHMEKLRPISQRLETVGRNIETVDRTLRPIAKEAYKEAKPLVKEAGQGVKRIGHGLASYAKYIASPTLSTTAFILTPRGRLVIDSYNKGDYSQIPQGSIRSYLLHAARVYGPFSLKGAASAFGDNGIAAAQLLAEQGLITRA